jgi:hypothetical protein
MTIDVMEAFDERSGLAIRGLSSVSLEAYFPAVPAALILAAGLASTGEERAVKGTVN